MRSQDVSLDLVQLLHFMEHTNEAPPADGECEKVRRLRKKLKRSSPTKR